MRKTALATLAGSAALAATLFGTTSAVAVGATPTCVQTCLLGVRAAAHDTYDRIVIDLGDGAIPGWQTSEQSTPLVWEGEEYPRREVPIKGDSYLKIQMTPVMTHDVNMKPVYTSASYESYGFSSLKGQALVYGFEDAATIGLALGPHSSYNVFKLTAPNRIVVDINH
ncbi:hypothetical protein AB0C52_30540 [Streptomyces sp. NPDC048717]|uniref:AMIN-like domain-containing (lipo)protein n=1 Tax=Streptomyces sp. NPDC048717 TaxID=3154928 RepID=UPI003447625E